MNEILDIQLYKIVLRICVNLFPLYTFLKKAQRDEMLVEKRSKGYYQIAIHSPYRWILNLFCFF